MNSIPSRRDMLKGGGALVVSFSLVPGRTLAQGGASTKPVAPTEVDSFLAIDARGAVFFRQGRCGTGVATALRQIVAEELDVALSDRPCRGDTT
jgi:hypothetical protein